MSQSITATDPQQMQVRAIMFGLDKAPASNTASVLPRCSNHVVAGLPRDSALLIAIALLIAFARLNTSNHKNH